MSADNGIYILRTPAPPIRNVRYNGVHEIISYTNQHHEYEYRVAHCQAIENLDYSDLYMPLLFGNSEVFNNEVDASNKAIQIQKEIEDSGWFTEYGICLIFKDCYFPNMTAETARLALDCYVGAIPV